MESTLNNPADLWYPLPRALTGEMLESGSESMKRFLWLITLCLAIVVAVSVSKQPGVWHVKELADHSRGSQRRLIKPRLTTEPGYAPCEPRTDANGAPSDVWCSAPPEDTSKPGRSPFKADQTPEDGVSRGLPRSEALPRDADSQRISSQSTEPLEQTIHRLEISDQHKPNNARTLSDLASAYFV